MNTREAASLIGAALSGRGGIWADMGTGSGTFTRALAECLGPDARIYAVDRNASALASLRRWARRNVIVVTADFTRSFELPGLAPGELDGLLFANSLHFVEEPEPVLARWAQELRPGGRVVVVEYDGRGPNRWVPYPIPAARWPEVAGTAGLISPAIRARRPSAFGGDLYVGTADR